MKKASSVIKVFLASLMSISLFSGSISSILAKETSTPVEAPISVNEEYRLYRNIPDSTWTSNDTEAIDEFNEMQDQITKSMVLKDGKYEYDYDVVRDIVYNFEFTKVNNQLGTNWNHENFLEEAINLIDNFENKESSEAFASTCSATRAAGCDENWESSGWNYGRTAMDTDTTTYYATLSENYSVGAVGLGSVAARMTALVPILSGILFAAGGATGFYYSSFASWLRYNNSLTDCGTVVDINKFTFVYTIWTQPEFANR